MIPVGPTQLRAFCDAGLTRTQRLFHSMQWENHFSKIALPGLGHTASEHGLQGTPEQVRPLM